MRSFIPLVALLSLASAQTNSMNSTTSLVPKPTKPANPFEVTCRPGFEPLCCPCITGGPTLCADTAPSCLLSECSQYYPKGWACCVGTGLNKSRYCTYASKVLGTKEIVFNDDGMTMGMTAMQAMAEDVTMMFKIEDSMM